MRDPPKSIHTRRKDKVGESLDILNEMEAGADRLNEAILEYPRGVNPFAAVNYTSNTGNMAGSLITRSGTAGAGGKPPRRIMEYSGAFRPPLRTREQLTPLSRLPRRCTKVLTQPEVLCASQQLGNYSNINDLAPFINPQLITHAVDTAKCLDIDEAPLQSAATVDLRKRILDVAVTANLNSTASPSENPAVEGAGVEIYLKSAWTGIPVHAPRTYVRNERVHDDSDLGMAAFIKPYASRAQGSTNALDLAFAPVQDQPPVCNLVRHKVYGENVFAHVHKVQERCHEKTDMLPYLKTPFRTGASSKQDMPWAHNAAEMTARQAYHRIALQDPLRVHNVNAAQCATDREHAASVLPNAHLFVNQHRPQPRGVVANTGMQAQEQALGTQKVYVERLGNKTAPLVSATSSIASSHAAQPLLGQVSLKQTTSRGGDGTLLDTRLGVVPPS